MIPLKRRAGRNHLCQETNVSLHPRNPEQGQFSLKPPINLRLKAARSQLLLLHLEFPKMDRDLGKGVFRPAGAVPTEMGSQSLHSRWAPSYLQGEWMALCKWLQRPVFLSQTTQVQLCSALPWKKGALKGSSSLLGGPRAGTTPRVLC